MHIDEIFNGDAQHFWGDQMERTGRSTIQTVNRCHWLNDWSTYLWEVQ